MAVYCVNSHATRRLFAAPLLRSTTSTLAMWCLRGSKWRPRLVQRMHCEFDAGGCECHISICRHEVASNDVEVGHQLVVDGLPPVPKLNDILSFYGKFGAVTHVRVDEEMHRAFVAFSTAEAVQKAVAVAPPRFKSANLRVSLCDEHGWRYATS
uniref:RRM_6 domain containing protein n=1 Tax=Echinococcus granulosus TaxID=6210 RepID=U6FVP7_ECHGR|nr:RRM_6 domain containing protein [Echinococcus granulosus]